MRAVNGALYLWVNGCPLHQLTRLVWSDHLSYRGDRRPGWLAAIEIHRYDLPAVIETMSCGIAFEGRCPEPCEIPVEQIDAAVKLGPMDAFTVHCPFWTHPMGGEDHGAVA